MQPKVNVQNMFSTPVMVVDNVLANLAEIEDVANNKVYPKYFNQPRWQQERENGNGLGTFFFNESVVKEFPLPLRSVVEQLQPHVDAYALALTRDPNIRAVPVKDWFIFYDTNSGCIKHHHLYRYVNGIIRVASINVILYIAALESDTLNIYWPFDSVQTSIGMLFPDDKAHSISLKPNRAIMIPAWVQHGVDTQVRNTRKIVMSINYEYVNDNPIRGAL
jgi:hypothetical protein